jgi:hypothetical protein
VISLIDAIDGSAGLVGRVVCLVSGARLVVGSSGQQPASMKPYLRTQACKGGAEDANMHVPGRKRTAVTSEINQLDGCFG